MSKLLLNVVDLFCERDERVLFESLSFKVSAGQLLQVAGPNGSGKTTLLKILCGLSTNYEGDIFWQGESIQQVREEFAASMLYFGHQPGVKGLLTPEENLRWYAAIHPSMDLRNLYQALEKVGLKGYEDVPCHSLSAGQNRRVSLARLYLTDAPLWILDEPFTAIDKQGVAEKEALIAQHVARGGSVILTTHHDLSSCGPITRLNLEEYVGT